VLNKKGFNNTVILFGIIIFYAFTFIMYGLYGSTLETYGYTNYADDETPQSYLESTLEEGKENLQNPWIIEYLSNSSGEDEIDKITWRNYFRNMIVGIREAPTWLNILLMTPLSMLVIYLIYKAIRGGGE
jgi:hypothetical protein